MTKKALKAFSLMLILFFFSCSLPSIITTIPQKIIKPQEDPVKYPYDISGSGEVKLRVEIESLASTGYSNRYQAQFIVTNIGTVPYTWKDGSKNKIVFARENYQEGENKINFNAEEEEEYTVQLFNSKPTNLIVCLKEN